MAWEDDVQQVAAKGRPRSVYDLARSWDSLRIALNQLQNHVGRLGAKTANDGSLTEQRPTSGPVIEKGKSWDGPAAEAFRTHVGKLSREISDLEDITFKVRAALFRAADGLAEGISKTPVPVFWDRDLPGGVDVEDIIGGKALGRDSGTEFAKRLTDDVGQGGEYYASGTGFKKRLDGAIRWTGDGIVQDGKQQGSTPGIRWYELNKEDNERYQRERDAWYNTNQTTAANAASGVRRAYQDEFSNVAPPELAATGTTQTDPYKPAGNPDPGGSPLGDIGNAAGAGDIPVTGAGDIAGGVDGIDPPDTGDIGAGTTPGGGLDELPGTGLAGVGGGIGGAGGSIGGAGGGIGGLGGGIGGAGGSLGGVGGGIGGAGGGLVGAGGGVAGLGRGIGGAGGGIGGAGVGRGAGIPGMVSPGAARAGSGRAPMPPLTNGTRALSSGAGAGGVGRAGTGGMGVMPGGMGARGAGGDNQAAPDDWLIEDDDVWGSQGDLPPGLLGR